MRAGACESDHDGAWCVSLQNLLARRGPRKKREGEECISWLFLNTKAAQPPSVDPVLHCTDDEGEKSGVLK